MIAKVRRRATSWASGERDGDSVAMARSDMRLERLAGKTGWIKGDRHNSYMDSAAGLQSPSSSEQQHEPVCQRRDQRRGGNRDPPGLNDRTRPIPPPPRGPPPPP